MNIKRIWTLLAPVTDSTNGKYLSRSGIVLVHIAALGLATATLPITSCLVAIVGMAFYMIGARRTMKEAESTTEVFRA